MATLSVGLLSCINDVISDKDILLIPGYSIAHHASVWSIWFNLLSLFIRVALDEAASHPGALTTQELSKKIQDELILGVRRMMLLGLASLLIGYGAFSFVEQSSLTWLAMMILSALMLLVRPFLA